MRLRTTIVAASIAAAAVVPTAASAAGSCTDSDGDGLYNAIASATSNHANANAANSIAACLTRGNVELEPNKIYPVSGTLLVSGRTLQGPWARSTTIQATAERSILVDLRSNATLRNVIVDGRFKSTQVVRAAGDRITIRDAQIRRSHRSKAHAHALNAQSTSKLLVERSHIGEAGFGGVDGSLTNGNNASGIRLVSSTNAVIRDNTIYDTAAAGIDVTKARFTTIQRNTIEDTGRISTVSRSETAGESGYASADGITGYHNADNVSRNLVIEHNVITNWANHGIHVSGRDIRISNNHLVDTGGERQYCRSGSRWVTTYAPCGYPLSLKDHKTAYDCTYNLVLQDNRVQPKVSGGTKYYAVMGTAHKDGGGFPWAVSATGNRDYTTGASLSPSTMVRVDSHTHC